MSVQQILAGISAASAGGSGAAAYYSAVTADSPTWYCRHSESSGTVADNDSGTDGTYASVALGSAALYAGGLTCADMTGSSAAKCTLPSSLFASAGLTAITLECIVKFPSVTGIRQIICRDNVTTGRRVFHWRLNGTTIELVKIVGGVQTVSATSAVSGGGTYHLAATITAGGAVTLYKNGASIQTGSFTAGADYSEPIEPFQINSRRDADSEPAGAYFAESAIYASALSGARILAHAQAAGF